MLSSFFQNYIQHPFNKVKDLVFGDYNKQFDRALKEQDLSTISNLLRRNLVTAVSPHGLIAALASDTLPLTFLNKIVSFPINQPNITITENEFCYLALVKAIELDRLDILHLLLKNPAVFDNLTAHENAALILAAERGRLAIMNCLLQFPQVVVHVAASDNAALRLAAKNGHLRALERLLEFDAVSTRAAANNNEAIKFAVNNNYKEIEKILIKLPSVIQNQTRWQKVKKFLKNVLSKLNLFRLNTRARVNWVFDNLVQITPVSIRDLVNNRENAMRALDRAQANSLLYLEQRYAQAFLERSRNDILAEIKDYLVSQTNLELIYSPEQGEAYFKEHFHSAYRYLFCGPNYWMTPAASYVSRDEFGLGTASIPDRDKDIIAHLWLLIEDEKFVTALGFESADLKVLFTQTLAGIGRAHNWDNDAARELLGLRERDDGGADKPSCSGGVTQRLVLLVQFILNGGSLGQALSADIFKRVFQERVIAKRPDQLGLLDKIQALDLVTLRKLDKVYDDLIIMYLGDVNDLNDEEKRVFSILSISDEEQEDFFTFCKLRFGASRFTQNQETPLKWAHLSFPSYQALARHFANDVSGVFYEAINPCIKARINELALLESATPVLLARTAQHCAPEANQINPSRAIRQEVR